MQLHQVERRQSRVLQAGSYVFFDVIGWKAVVHRILSAAGPLEILRWNLGGRIELAIWKITDQVTKNGFAFAGAVTPGRVKEIASQLHRSAQSPIHFVQIGTGPPRHPPHSIADLAHLPIGSSKTTIFHSLNVLARVLFANI